MSLQQKQHHLTAEDYAQLMDLLNYMHPFREGNGRSTRLFLQCYAVNHLFILLTNDNLIQALTDADVAKIAKLIKIENV